MMTRKSGQTHSWVNIFFANCRHNRLREGSQVERCRAGDMLTRPYSSVCEAPVIGGGIATREKICSYWTWRLRS